MTQDHKKPLVSIIVPICNNERYVKECVESIQKQSLTDIEIICVDDGSKDHSLEIVEKLQKSDNRIKVLSKENTGYGDSVNKGIAIARGYYIGIVESDDFIDENMYKELLELSQDGKVDIVKGNFWDYYDFPNKPGKSVVNKERQKMPPKNQTFTIREEPNILWGHPSVWSAIYKKDFLDQYQIRFQCERGGGWVDNPFFFETLCHARSVCWTDTPYYYYRKTNENSSSNNQADLTLPLRRMIDNLDVMEKNGYCDEDVLLFLYARALMYYTGLFPEKNYAKQKDKIRPYVLKLMKRLDRTVLEKNFNTEDRITYYRAISCLQDLVSKNNKILIYNWIPFDNPQGFGGGVNIYCRNLIRAIIQQRPDITIYFLSSGWSYDLSVDHPYVRPTNNMFGSRCRSFEIVNSPVPAAQDMILNNPEIAIKNSELRRVFLDFLSDYGKFDVIHFNNIEGLSLDCLDLKECEPEIKTVYSMHNYIPVCVTGFYYQRHNKCNCSPLRTPEDCKKCTDIGRKNNLSETIYNRGKAGATRQTLMPRPEWLKALGLDRMDEIKDGQAYSDFCKAAVSRINNFNVILAVSECVKRIAIENGIDAQKVRVSYIGTEIASFQIRKSIAPIRERLKIGFLGNDYYFEEKGYPFLVETLRSMNESDKQKIDLILTMTRGDETELRKELQGFHSIEIVHGYTHAQLKHLLKDVNLGVVPVLWEDNLPQIAIEMAALGVPVLASNRGGASELCKDDLFRFEGGNQEDFKNHILQFVHDPAKLNLYWEKSTPLVTMHQHIQDLEEIYQIPKENPRFVSLEEYSLLLEENEFLYSVANYTGNNSDRDIQKSISYRIGRAITYVPRKVRGLVLCLNQNGLTYTFHRSLFHIHRFAGRFLPQKS